MTNPKKRAKKNERSRRKKAHKKHLKLMSLWFQNGTSKKMWDEGKIKKFKKVKINTRKTVESLAVKESNDGKSRARAKVQSATK